MNHLPADSFRRRVLAGLPSVATHTPEVPAARRMGEARTVDVAPLRAIVDDNQFIEEAYRRILGREPDVSGLLHHGEALRNGFPRELILERLMNSAEARRLGFRFEGVPNTVLSFGAWLKYLRRGGLNSAKRRWAARLRAIAKEVLQIGRMERIERTVDALLNQVLVRFDHISAKTDESLWTISTKLDTYVVDVEARQGHTNELLQMNTNSLAGSLRSLAADVDIATRAAATKLDTCVVDVEARQRETNELLLTNANKVADSIRSLSANVDSATQAAARQALERYSQIQSQLDAIAVSQRATLARVKELEKHSGAILQELDRIAAITEKVGNVVACELDGFIVGVPQDEWRMAAYHALRGVMEPGLVALFKNLIRPGMVVVDVGANVGLFTLEAARLTGSAGRVYSFEPTPRIFSLLMDNIQVNGYLESGIVIPKQMAVLDRTGGATLRIYRHDSGHNTLFGADNADEELQVETVSLDEALSSVTRVDVVKIDAEGSEPWILDGMKGIISRNPGIRILLEFAPEHLRRANVEPVSFLDSITRLGLAFARVDDLSGEPRHFPTEELLAFKTSNLFLTSEGRGA
ncbi:MAG: FkbM family methyltransferase [Bryobacteraceae bacterium]